eukprot:CAMPEP_0197080722 /NCGR_PEP_ID=MMETSP1384-20130603/214275_1 /TAXON_ID=29189 /ORGANISM="Ammonia sp." /LENGTH=408 /DNA_ID=CAMNT_0042519613 /DNA_START=97 /DNA_END=1323 /DNA_ORIENTATION=+
MSWLFPSLLLSSSTLTFATIYCPDSNGDNTALNGVDYGINVFKLADTTYAADCYLRYGNKDSESSTVIQQWIDSTKDIVVFAHGWQPSSDGTHAADEVWQNTVASSCVSGSNNGYYASGQTEPCEPTDHDAQYWIAAGFNVLYLDWRYFAYEPSEVKDAEKKLYKTAYNGKTVVQLLFDQLNALLDDAQWNGNEMRFAGHSLGSQLVISLAAQFKQQSGNAYKNRLKRVALLDHFFSNGGKNYLPQIDPGCNDWCLWGVCWECDHYWTGEWARNVLLPIIRDAYNEPVVIENYRSSPTSSNPFIGDENADLNKRTVMVELKPWYYSSVQLTEKHMAAYADYVHCMKFTGSLNQNTPNCRMSTAELKSTYCPSNGVSTCLKRFVQQDSSNPGHAYTTWDVDNLYAVYNV